MKSVLILNHSDEVSGTTTYDTGHVAHWCEDGEVVVVHPDGSVTKEDLARCATPLAKALAELEQNGPDADAVIRMMLPVEEKLHNAMRS